MRCQWKTEDHQTENTESSDQYYSLLGGLALLMEQQHYNNYVHTSIILINT